MFETSNIIRRTITDLSPGRRCEASDVTKAGLCQQKSVKQQKKIQSPRDNYLNLFPDITHLRSLDH